MKNVIKIYDSTVTKVEKVYLCYGHKAYKKFSEKRYGPNACIEKAAIAVLWDRHNGRYEVCIGIKKWNNPLELKGLIVHEMSHAIDYIMRENDLTDTEYRAYTMQSMYQIAISFIDDVITNKQRKSQR